MEDEPVGFCRYIAGAVLNGLLFAALAAGRAGPVLGATGSQAASRTQQTPVILDSAVTLLLGPEEPLPIAEAARDLAGDFEKVLGKKPKKKVFVVSKKKSKVKRKK